MRSLIQNGGLFQGFPLIKVTVDDTGDANVANYLDRTLTLSLGNAADGPGCDTVAGKKLNGSQDGTIVAHELAHMATVHMQLGNPVNQCGPDGCPVANQYNRRFFHDYADGYAAMLMESPCIGGWAGKNLGIASGVVLPNQAAVFDACARASETFELPRLLFADSSPDLAFAGMSPGTIVPRTLGGRFVADAFPTHRGQGGGAGEYSDGQIVGAALWHLWEELRGLGDLATVSLLWGRVNKGIFATGFNPTVCPAGSGGCDANVYRAGREFLFHLADAWINAGAAQSLNKMLSAFARTGLFLAPVSCLDGALNDNQEQTVDPTLCPGGNTAADAIVDIDDNVTGDGSERLGIRMREDDYVKRDGTLAPSFRVWTGAPFSFKSTGEADPSLAGALCNDRFEVTLESETLSGQTFTLSSHEQSVGPQSCFGTWNVDPNEWQMFAGAIDKAAAGLPKVKVEYKVRTFRAGPTGAPPTNERLSTQPGHDLWGTPQPPAVFFLNADGRTSS
jgi:hypothetical protein